MPPTHDVLTTPEHVVLVDSLGVPTGTVPKAGAHHRATPLHLAFSCYLVRPDGAVLLTRRADAKPTWPGVWTNACCGHPSLGETLREAVARRIAAELGATSDELTVLVPDYAYRATMADGTVEHELCPVVAARVDGELRPDPDEVGAVEWVHWPDLVERAWTDPDSLSPWCVEQVRMLDTAGLAPDQPPSPFGEPSLLDRPIEVTGSPPARPPVATGVDPLGPVLAPLEQVLDALLADKRAELRAIHVDLEEVADEVAGLVRAGGKRLRPAFVHWGHRAAAPRGDEQVLDAAAAMELLHTFALLHDDVMDRSSLRRGRPTAHLGFAERHRRRGGDGDAAWFGTSAAILAGDLAHVWADEAFERTDRPPHVLERARRVYTALRTEVIAGQHLDLRLAGERHATEEAAVRIALLKSARYTVTRPLQLGAALAPAPSAEVEAALTGFGDAVGVAFQMRDDVLGLFGDAERTGKSAVDDLREGKRTLLVLRAQRLADPAGVAVLADALGDPELDEVGAARCQEVVAGSGALASVERLIDAQHDRALAHLAPVPAEAREALTVLAERAVVREV